MLNDDEAVERLINTAKVKGARLIVLDTLARVMAGGNENAPDDMGQLIGNCDRLRQESGSHVMLVHHTGKDEARGARGHSSLRAATDTEIEVSGGNGLSFAKVTKQRELEIEGEFAFSLHVVSLGVDKRGKEVTSCVVVPEEATKKVRPKRPNGPVKRTVLKALQNAVDEAMDAIDKQHETPTVIELGICTDDHEAQTLGWLTASIHRRVIGMVAAQCIELGHKVEVVPRGTTIATATAIAAHNK